MRTILFSIILFFLLWGYASDILNAAPACTWRYKWVWDGSTRYACELNIGCWVNNGKQKRTAKCVREDGDGTSIAVAVANCATWDPYTGAKSLIETYDNGTCTIPCNAVCWASHTTYTASQPANTNLCDTNTTYSTGFTWTDTTAVTAGPVPAYSYKWNCASKNGGSLASCYAYKPTTGSCDNTTALWCSIGSAINDNSQTTCNTTRTWNCSWVNTGGSSVLCSKANPVCSYTITFNGNGSTAWTMWAQSIAQSTTANLNANNFTRTSYTFIWWSTTAWWAVAYANSASYTMGSSNVTLYAQWTAYILQNTKKCVGEDLKWVDSLNVVGALIQTCGGTPGLRCGNSGLKDINHNIIDTTAQCCTNTTHVSINGYCIPRQGVWGYCFANNSCLSLNCVSNVCQP